MQSFRGTWFQKVKTEVFEKARDIVFAVYSIQRTDIAKIQTQLPEEAKEDSWILRRQGLFKVHTTRLRLKDIIRNTTNLQHSLADNLRDCVTGKQSHAKETQRQDIVAELSDLEDLKFDCRQVLRNSTLDNIAIKMLDKLLEKVDRGDDNDLLYRMGADGFTMPAELEEDDDDDEGPVARNKGKGSQSAAQSDDDNDTELGVLPVDQIIDDICKAHSFVADYADDRDAKSWTEGVLQTRRAKPKDTYKGLDDVGALQGSKYVSLQELSELEKDCGKVSLSEHDGPVHN